MKKTLLAIILCGSLGITNAMASANEEAIQKRVDEVKSEFNLSDQQAKRIAKILTYAGMSEDERKAARMEKRLNKHLSHMREKLSLTDGQASQLKALIQQQHGKMRMPREQMKARIYSILTPEQANKFDEMRDQHKKGRHGHHGKRMHRGGHHGKQMHRGKSPHGKRMHHKGHHGKTMKRGQGHSMCDKH